MGRELLLRAWDEISETMVYAGSVHLNALITNKTIISYYSNLMRCILLKDKNGKLIYEDDLVRIKGREINVIEDCGFMIAPFHPGSPYDETILPEDVEIVGNIFENPDLFEPIRLRREEYERRQHEAALERENFKEDSSDELAF